MSEGDRPRVGDERVRCLGPGSLHPGHIGERGVGNEREEVPIPGLQPFPHQLEPVDTVAPVRGVAVVLDRYRDVFRVINAEEGEGLPEFRLHVVGGADPRRVVSRRGGADIDPHRPDPLRVVVEGRRGLRGGMDRKACRQVLAYRAGVRAAAHQEPFEEDRAPGPGRLPDLCRHDHGRGGEDQFDAVLDRPAGLVDQDVLGAPADVDRKKRGFEIDHG